VSRSAQVAASWPASADSSATTSSPRWATRAVLVTNRLSLLSSGEPITAAQAVGIGLITEAVPRAELDERVDALASSIASKSPIVLKLGRDAYYAQRDLAFDDQLAYLTDQLAAVAATEDSAEGTKAFLEKRPPSWLGR